MGIDPLPSPFFAFRLSFTLGGFALANTLRRLSGATSSRSTGRTLLPKLMRVIRIVTTVPKLVINDNYLVRADWIQSAWNRVINIPMSAKQVLQGRGVISTVQSVNTVNVTMAHADSHGEVVQINYGACSSLPTNLDVMLGSHCASRVPS